MNEIIETKSTRIIRLDLQNFKNEVELLDEILTDALMKIGEAGVHQDPMREINIGLLMIDMYRDRLFKTIDRLEEDLLD